MTQEARGTPVKVSEYKFKQSLQRSTVSTVTWTTILTSGSTVCRILGRIKKEMWSFIIFAVCRNLHCWHLLWHYGWDTLFCFCFCFSFVISLSADCHSTHLPIKLWCAWDFFFFCRMWLPSLWLQPASVSVKLLDILKGDLGTISTQVCGSKKQISLTRSWNISSLVCGRNIYF